MGSVSTEGAELLFPAFFGPPVLQAPIEAGASVRFYPVHSDLRVDAADIRAAITPRTRAIYLIHFNGFPGPIADVMEIAREHDLIVFEDAAHAMLTTIDGRPAGSFGDGAIYLVLQVGAGTQWRCPDYQRTHDSPVPEANPAA